MASNPPSIADLRALVRQLETERAKPMPADPAARAAVLLQCLRIAVDIVALVRAIKAEQAAAGPAADNGTSASSNARNT